MTKTAFRCVQIVLLFYGVFGADEDEVKAVSVMEGDSVTLNPLTQIHEFNLIEWRFGDPIIAQADRKDISYPSHTEIFRGRLQLDQTGSLTIKNMKTKHSGLYKLKISHDAGTAERKFNVTVYDPPSVIDAGESEMKSVSVMSGDRVTLQTGVTPLSGDELIVWRFGDEGKLIAKADIEAKSSSLYYDERFRDRLELELNQTGYLTITDTRSTDSGFYSVKISSRTQTVHKRFSVSVSERGLSSGAVAGIVVAILLVLAVVAAAAAAGFIYHRRKISELQKQTLTVKEGEDITLKPNKTIQKDDQIQWIFGPQYVLIAKIREETGEICIYDDVLDGRFRGRLKLEKTGSLTITDIKPEHTGLYILLIISSRRTLFKIFRVSIPLRYVSVTAGDSVLLSTGRPKIERDDVIQWRCGDEIIAEIKGGIGETHDGADGRFRDRLQLDKITGDLTIKNSTAKDKGYYNLKIISSKGNRNWTYSVIIIGKPREKSQMKGNNDESVVEMQSLLDE